METKTKQKGFSLVEMIVVIGILLILVITATLIITKWVGNSRDSNRLSDISTIKRSLEIGRADKEKKVKYPMPDDANEFSSIITGVIDGKDVLYKGTVGTGVVKELGNLNKIPKDPANPERRYAYGVTEDREEYQLATILESGKKISHRWKNEVYAGERSASVDGNYEGIPYIYQDDNGEYHVSNIPSLIYNGCDMGSGVDLLSGDTVYVRNGGKNLPYDVVKDKEEMKENICQLVETPNEVVKEVLKEQEGSLDSSDETDGSDDGGSSIEDVNEEDIKVIDINIGGGSGGEETDDSLQLNSEEVVLLGGDKEKIEEETDLEEIEEVNSPLGIEFVNPDGETLSCSKCK